MEENCFTMLCWFLPYSNMNQPQVYTHALPLEPLSHLPLIPLPRGCHRAPNLSSLRQRCELAAWRSKFPLPIYSTRASGCISMLLSQLVPPSPSPTVSTVCSLCLCLHCCTFKQLRCPGLSSHWNFRLVMRQTSSRSRPSLQRTSFQMTAFTLAAFEPEVLLTLLTLKLDFNIFKEC